MLTKSVTYRINNTTHYFLTSSIKRSSRYNKISVKTKASVTRRSRSIDPYWSWNKQRKIQESSPFRTSGTPEVALLHLRLKEVENIRTTRNTSRWLFIAVACVQFTRRWRSDEAILSRARDPVRHWIPPGTRRLILYLAPRLATGVATPTPRTPSQPSLFAFPPSFHSPLYTISMVIRRSPRFFALLDTFDLYMDPCCTGWCSDLPSSAREEGEESLTGDLWTIPVSKGGLNGVEWA